MMLKLKVGIALLILLNGVAFARTTNTIEPMVKLEPQIRVEPVVNDTAIIPIEEIRPFLETSLILDCKEEFTYAPYVVAEDESRMQGGTGSVLYVKGIKDDESQYTIYKEGKTYTHPVTGEMLGFEAEAIGTAELKTPGNPAEFEVKSAKTGIEIGTRLLPSFTNELPATLTLRPANEMEVGYILSVRNGLNQIGRNQVVLISLGQQDGVEAGNILDIYQTGRKVIDPYFTGWRKKSVQLPDTRVGNLLVFQVYDKLSLALVLEATEIVHLLDKVKSP